MAPSSKKEDDLEFIMTCLKHTDGLPKPDFDQVAAALGAKDAKTCYHRHWRLMNDWGMTKKRGKQPIGSNNVATAISGDVPGPSASDGSDKKRKRVAPKKPAKKADDAVDSEDDIEEVEIPVKKVKCKANGGDSMIKPAKNDED